MPCMPTVWADVRSTPAGGLLHRAAHASH